MVHIYDMNVSRIMTKFLDMNLLEGREASIADAMFENINNLLDVNSIEWDHCMAIGLDNMNVNIGDHNLIKYHAQEKNNDILIAGGLYHILHNASGKAGTAFLQIISFDIETLALMFSTGLINPAKGEIFWRNIINSMIPSMQK